MSGWSDQEPDEWREGMLILVVDHHGRLRVDVIGSCTITSEYGYWDGKSYMTHRDTPGTEVDGEGLGTDHWHWGENIIGWHPGVSTMIGDVLTDLRGSLPDIQAVPRELKP